MYLDEQELVSRLSLGKPVEQWLGVDIKTDYEILKWVRINKEEDDSYVVAYHEMFDDGGENFLDIYAFESVDPDEPYGVITEFTNYVDALSFCLGKYGCSWDKFVGTGMIQEEYRRYRLSL